ncbi:terminase large subunit [Lactiplantibacillus plantarum]|uniref:terminase large subunit n=1 Tax=Lactiplantibacillus plantarum TaxID=1590 RepID=UPI0021A530F8|nr:terminase TerL endonuclease subunit [Lactiplantibacillus plantarum]MCT3214976.1 terminase large subunit [Lactiplantibacillus plantarum]MCT3272026.1 terminase large subunit [Lactiplantibacillus plantarum]
MKIDLTQTHDVLGAYQSIDWTAIREQYTDDGTQYAFKVLDGEIVTGYQVKLAAFRHLRDLQRQGSVDFPYTYSGKKVHQILKFASACPEIKTMKPVKLMDWQKFILAMLVGWRNEYGDKRFTRAIVSVARHQGKTYLMAIITLFSFLVESLGESGQDFLVSSINFKQTSKLMGYVKKMLRQVLEIEPFKTLGKHAEINLKSLASESDQIVAHETGNKLRAITYKSGQYDSFHFKTAIGDEFGDPEVSSSSKITKITSGQVDVSNKQFIQISTAYPNPAVPFHNDEKRVTQLMEQDFKREGENYLCLVWAQDDEAETFKPELWAKSNPMLNMTSKADRMLNDLKNERDNDALAGSIIDFKNKSMNIWLQQAANSFLKLSDIESAIVPKFNIDGRQVYIGFDYSMFSDNTAFAFIYPNADVEKPEWFVSQHSFIPWRNAGSIEAKEKQDGINYREMARRGYCTITSHPQGLINDDQIYKWLLDYVDEHNLEVVFFGYDAMGVTTMIKQLDLNTSWPLNPIRQRTGELKDPTKFLQTAFIEGSVKRFDDPIMEKALLNAELVEDKVGIQVDKAKATLKIDVVDAIVDAFYQGMYHFEDFADVNNPDKQVERMTDQQVVDWLNDPDSGMLEGGDGDDY